MHTRLAICRLNGLCEPGAYGKDGQEPARAATRSEGQNPSLPSVGKHAVVESYRQGGRRSGREPRLSW
jgi:hypothetical protein